MCTTDCEVVVGQVVPIQVLRSSWTKSPSTTSTINNISEEEPRSRSPIFTSCDESRSPEQQEDKRAERGGLSGLSKEALGAREEKRRGRKGR